MKKFIKSDIAVSEAVGFVQTLAIVIISTSIVYFAGSPILEKTEKNAHFLEMEKGFIFLAGNIEKVGFDRAPIRNTELKIMGGAITVARESNMTIGDVPYSLGSVEYRFEDKVIAYENGGIWIKHPGGEVIIVSQPRFSFGNLSTVHALELLGDYYIAGEGGIRINSKISTSKLDSIPAVNGSIWVNVTSSYYRGWEEYLTGIGGRNMITDDLNNTVAANFATDMVNVDHNRIIVKILEE